MDINIIAVMIMGFLAGFVAGTIVGGLAIGYKAIKTVREFYQNKGIN